MALSPKSTADLKTVLDLLSKIPASKAIIEVDRDLRAAFYKELAEDSEKETSC